MKNNTLPILIVLIIIYFLLKYAIPYWDFVIYPINLLVTFLHEFGHAFFALITWWSVHEIEVNADGSWLATTSGWWQVFILMWWYIWSALFWNLLLRIWLQDKKNVSEKTLYILAGILVWVSLMWFSGFVSTVILLLLAIGLVLLAKYTHYDTFILQFLWVACLLFIIEDFNVWPSSDLSKFSEIFIIVPQWVWMIIWLIVVVAMTLYNLRMIYRK